MAGEIRARLNNSDIKDAFMRALSDGEFGVFVLEKVTIRCINELCNRDIQKAERVFNTAKRHYKKWWRLYGSPSAQARIQQERLDALNREMLKGDWNDE